MTNGDGGKRNLGAPDEMDDFVEFNADELTTIDPSSELDSFTPQPASGAGFQDILDVDDMALLDALDGETVRGAPPAVPVGVPAGRPVARAVAGRKPRATGRVAPTPTSTPPHPRARVAPPLSAPEPSVGSREDERAGDLAGDWEVPADVQAFAQAQGSEDNVHAEIDHPIVGDFADSDVEGSEAFPDDEAYADVEGLQALVEDVEFGAAPEDEYDFGRPTSDDPAVDIGPPTPSDPIEAPTPTPASPPSPVAPVAVAPVVAAAAPVAPVAVRPTRREPPPELAGATYLFDHAVYRGESQRLARTRKWNELATMTQAALDYAEWATLPEVRSAILLEMARLYRDQIGDAEKAEEAFRTVALEDPTKREAVAFLDDAYRVRGDYRALHDLYAAAIERTWDPSERLQRTRDAVELAVGPLNDSALAIKDWEHLWTLGEHGEEVATALTNAYRQHGHWESLASFLFDGTEDMVELRARTYRREVAEIYLSAIRAPERAAAIVDWIRSTRPNDPIALLNLARISFQAKDFDQLAALSRIEGMDPKVAADIHKVAADALWQAGERDLAVDVFETLLQRDPEDTEALRAKERHFVEANKHSALVAFYEGRADRTLPDGNRPPLTEQVELLEKAALIAEEKLREPTRAIGFWQVRIDRAGPTARAYRKLTELYDEIGDLNGVAGALEGLLEQTRVPKARAEIIARLGEIYSSHLNNDQKGEECWRALLELKPGDPVAQAELASIYERRRDYNALDKALRRQIANADENELVELGYRAARNIEENIEDGKRAVAAWEQLLDYAPNELDALTSLAARLGELDRERERLAALELRIHSAEAERRIELSLELAEAWAKANDNFAAVASYERVLRWDPCNVRALEGLSALAKGDELGALNGALELAANLSEDGATRIERLRSVLSHIPKEDKDRTVGLLRRLIVLGDEGALDTLKTYVAENERHEDLVAVYLRLASEADFEGRTALLQTLKALYEGPLLDGERAFLAIASSGYQPTQHLGLLDELERLGKLTGRWEDLLAIYDGLATAAFDTTQRQVALEAQFRILDSELKKPARALDILARILVLDPMNAEILLRAEALAKANNLAPQLLGLYGELWDRSENEAVRTAIAAKRHGLVKDVLADPKSALNELLLRHRTATNKEIRTQLLDAATELDAWGIVLPRIEAFERAVETPSTEGLVEVAKLYEEKLGAKDRAMELYAEVLLMDASHSTAPDELARLAQETAQASRQAMALRSAAAHATNKDDALALYARVAELLFGTLQDPSRAIDIHRRILRLADGKRESLDALIQWHRDNNEWAELRDRLKQRIESTEGAAENIDLWMEVAQLSTDHLDDSEGALDAYAKILTQTPDHLGAREGVAALTGGNMTPEVAARRLRLELNLAAEEDRPAALAALAKLQDEELKHPEAARVTWQQLVELTGAAGEGYAPLADVLERLEEWDALILLLEARAQAVGDEETAALALERALSLCDEHGGSPDDGERLATKLRTLRPDDDQLRGRLARAMRENGRWEELVALLRSSLESISEGESKRSVQRELARTLDLALHKTAEAKEVLEAVLSKRPNDEATLLHMASLARRNESFGEYVKARQAQAMSIDPAWGAWILCHLAEGADENDLPQQVANHYRAARDLNPKNPAAADALRSLGRRSKSWRQTAAILPNENEKELSWAQRSELLRERGKAAMASDMEQAMDWLHRALVVDPENIKAWRALASAEIAVGDTEGQLRSLKGALGAFERSVPPSPDRLLEHAELLHAIAGASREAGDEVLARRSDFEAYGIAPGFAPAALAVAAIREADGDLASAYELYDHLLEKPSNLTEEVRNQAVFKRGALAARLGDTSKAIDDLRATVRANPLHADGLNALAEIHSEQGHAALALASLQQALVLAVSGEKRGHLYHKMGRLWEEGLSDPEEAGIYYELALDHGASDPFLMKRALAHYRRDGRNEAALTMVDELTQSTEDPSVLATLWVTRGEILEQSKPDEAIEAFDMALSYEPGMGAALNGLERMLAAREEWEQLADLLEGRIENEENDKKRAAALSRLANLCERELGEPARANESLRRLMALDPMSDAAERLIINLADAPIEEKRDLVEHAVEFGSNRYDHAISLAKFHLDANDRQQAWAVLSPLRVVIHLEADIKNTVNDLRQEYERSENNELLEKGKFARLKSSPLRDALLEAIALLPGKLGITDVEVAAPGAVNVAESTPNGKLFVSLREALGVDDAQLFRSVDMEENIAVVNSDPVIVCIKTEIFQKASGGELRFWLAQGLELARKETRAITSLPPTKRASFALSLLQALGLVKEGGDAETIKTLKAMLTEELTTQLKEVLELVVEEMGIDRAQSFWDDTLNSAERVASFLVADLRSTWRALARTYTTIPEQRTIKTIEELNTMFDESKVLSRLLRFHVSDEFSALLK
ncbi:MAG: hypothetical protein AUK47_12380 [Deltaproteobacteria bacterium CG2_30_63_29]|nr:MAG: hypothetical protein AUK47_12380 [Deltaproteobacteria bacterium CG2_30_63_29]